MSGAAAVLPQLALTALRQVRSLISTPKLSSILQDSLNSSLVSIGQLKPNTTTPTAATDSHLTQLQSSIATQLAPAMLQPLEQQALEQQQSHAAQLPAQQQWTPQQEHFMGLAIEQAKLALKLREVPIG
jgi:hypothetical protein